MMRTKRIAVALAFIGLFGGQALWAAWMSGGLLERDANRLEGARKSHASDIDRAFNVYSNQVDRANATLTRIYEQAIRQYENRGDRAVAESLKKELEEITKGALAMPFPDDAKPKTDEPPPPNSHVQLINSIGPQVVNASGDRGRTAGLVDYDYVLLYYTAGWCAPCRAFTPQLIEFYNENKSRAKWEVIVVSGDRSESAFFDYLRNANMPWAAVPYERIGASGLVERFPGGWPRMAVLDRDGRTVMRGNQSMLNDFRDLLHRR